MRGVMALIAVGLCVSSALAGPRKPDLPSATSNAGWAGTSGTGVTQAQQVFNTLSDAQRVGQLLMVGASSTSVSGTTLTAIRKYDVGSVILNGNSYLSVSQERAITAALQAAAPARPKLFIATDQEGGRVQRLRGPGFSILPSAVVQGTWSPWWLQTKATKWARELRAAGITVDLAPVLDTVPPADRNNPPIGQLDREYGHYPSLVRSRGTAVLRGFVAAGLVATGKHFPGLGRVTANTDTSRGVTDWTTTSTDAYLVPFAGATASGVPFMMVSTAVYARIDAANPAAFSSRIITGLLRNSLHFHGVVISDDLGAARQVSAYPLAARAVRFISAGGDMILTVNATQAATMTSALLTRMRTDSAFKKQVYTAALRVLTAKQAHNLLP